jgi:hypothetical protein
MGLMRSEALWHRLGVSWLYVDLLGGGGGEGMAITQLSGGNACGRSATGRGEDRLILRSIIFIVRQSSCASVFTMGRDAIRKPAAPRKSILGREIGCGPAHGQLALNDWSMVPFQSSRAWIAARGTSWSDALLIYG